MLELVWLYGSQLWGCAVVLNVGMVQTFQSGVVRSIVDAFWCVGGDGIHRDLQIPMVAEEIKKTAVRHKERLAHHINTEVLQLVDHQHAVRKLKRKKPFDLV